MLRKTRENGIFKKNELLMDSSSFSSELVNILKYMHEVVIEEYPTNKITTDYFIFTSLLYKDSLAHEALSRILLDNTIDELKLLFHDELSNKPEGIICDKPTANPKFRQCLEDPFSLIGIKGVDDNGKRLPIKSIHVLCAALTIDSWGKNTLQRMGATAELLKKDDLLDFQEDCQVTDVVVYEPKLPEPKKKEKPIKHLKPQPKYHEPLSVHTINQNGLEISHEAINVIREGREILHRENLAQEILTVLLKKNRNKVFLVGENGVGKSSMAEYITYLIQEGKVPQPFKKAEVVRFDLPKICNHPSEEAIRNNARSLISTLTSKDGYIIFFDDIHLMDNLNNCLVALQVFLNTPSTHVISTITPEAYTTFFEGKNGYVMTRHTQKINIEEPTEEECIDMVNHSKGGIEAFYDVSFSKDAITNAVPLAKRYIADQKMPSSVMDLLDMTGAILLSEKKESRKITSLRKELERKTQEKEQYKKNSKHKDYDLIDGLTKEIIQLQSDIKLTVKDELFAKKPQKVSANDIKKAISKKTGIPLTEVSADEKQRLKGMSADLSSIVIGQDEAVDEVCRVIKRQRVGLANPNKPAVLFFGGSTGTGKSYLAKKIAEKVFGDEKYLVRLDMSEYNDKIAVNKLYGASSGYVGYEQGGILTSAINKKKHCVLLLDEIEKADTAVHDVFLQIFDDGQLTDNHGVVVDFKNVIVIMTSNVGAKDVVERGGGVGFNRGENNYDKSIIERALKRTFKPEFINRIDKIVYFNKLSDDNLRDIIKLEIAKVNERILKIGYSLDRGVLDGDMVNAIFSKAKESKEYGARPILRLVQSEIEDKIADKIIEEEVGKGHTFTMEDFA